MSITAIAGSILFLAGLALSIVVIVQAFKVSVVRGILALLAPLLLAGGIISLASFAHGVAMSEVGAKEVQEQGDKEFKEQINELDELENLEL